MTSVDAARALQRDLQDGDCYTFVFAGDQDGLRFFNAFLKHIAPPGDDVQRYGFESEDGERVAVLTVPQRYILPDRVKTLLEDESIKRDGSHVFVMATGPRVFMPSGYASRATNMVSVLERFGIRLAGPEAEGN